MQTNFLDISYLVNGNQKQKQAYEVLKRTKVFSLLASYNPILVGTIPIGIDIQKSDLDIVCDFKEVELFAQVLSSDFSGYPDFHIRKKSTSLLVANFFMEEFEIEIYASQIPSMQTNGYRHMIIEWRLLNLLGNTFKEEVVKLKQQGIKTEPAFGQLLKLWGNPYEELLKLENLSDKELKQLYKDRNKTSIK